MTTRDKGSKRSQDSSKAQQARNPMLAVRLPRSLYRALRKAARNDDRTFPDWFRRKLSFWLAYDERREALQMMEPVESTEGTLPRHLLVSGNKLYELGNSSASAGVARHSESESK